VGVVTDVGLFLDLLARTLIPAPLNPAPLNPAQ
jgi:hypothetical protein